MPARLPRILDGPRTPPLTRRLLPLWISLRLGLVPAQPGKQFLVRAEQLLISLPGAAGVFAHQSGAPDGRGGIFAVVTWHLGHDDSGMGRRPVPC